MFNIGDIVNHSNLVFRDGEVDKKVNRPCVVIYDNEDEEFVLTIPLTSTVKSFNRHNENYVFIPYVVYDYHKLSFAKIDNILINSYSNTKNTDLRVDNETVVSILEKMADNPRNEEYSNLIKECLLNFKNKLVDSKEVKRLNKIEKKRKKKEAKKSIILK